MFTIILAWMNAKYDQDYCFLFLGTVYIDVTMVENLWKLFA